MKRQRIYKCNKCNAVFTITVNTEGDIVPQDDNYFVCCPMCGRTGWKALEQID